MRQEHRFRPGFEFRWSATTILMAVIAVCFCAQQLISFRFIEDYLALSASGLKRGFVWQLLSFQFLHDGLLHFLFNLVTLWSFGRVLEYRLGARRFLWAYFLAGVSGGALQTALALALPSVYGGYLFGASAGICGLMAVFCLLEPDVPIFPFFLKARYVLVLLVGVAVALIIFPVGPRISHAAHLGGLLVGVLWVKLGWQHDYVVMPWERWLARLRRSRPARRQPELVSTAAQKGAAWRTSRARPEPEPAPEEFISQQVDPILDKISAQGIQSLTEAERKVLEAARKKMGRR
jgi:membrane associated rhomboid family serine protease